jgi:glycosyltransferase involved in cell wall biosynthesis
MKPLISILLPVYNGEQYLEAAVHSVLSQDYPNYELIAINDGSSDGSELIITSILDARMLGVSQQNQGLAATLNRGIELAKGQYIARLDQDDLMLSTRLAKQVEYLESHPDSAMVGTWSEIWVGTKPTDRGHKHPISHEALQLELLFDNPFVHSSVMMRADALHALGSYSEDKSRQPPEDYELWSRISRKYRVANIPEVLTVYREVEGSMSRTGDNPFLANVIQISAENLAVRLTPKFSVNECYLLASMYHGRKPENKKKMLPKSRALLMHREAALIIGGEFLKWSEEFTASYHRQQSQIKSQFMRRLLPSILLRPARVIRNMLKQSVLYILRGH